jgi:AcrR family transcriptional regulator
MSARRMGTESSATRSVLLDHAEQLMISEGYAAVGVRRVAREAGVTPGLIHYYFRTLDDLFLALLRRNAERQLESLQEIAASERPLHALWERGTYRDGAAMTTEFIALANHRKAIRSEIAAHAERFRQAEVEIIATSLVGGNEDVPAVALSALLAYVSRTLVLEEALGLTLGHAETLALVQRYLNSIEPEATASTRPAVRTATATRRRTSS